MDTVNLICPYFGDTKNRLEVVYCMNDSSCCIDCLDDLRNDYAAAKELMDLDVKYINKQNECKKKECAKKHLKGKVEACRKPNEICVKRYEQLEIMRKKIADRKKNETITLKNVLEFLADWKYNGNVKNPGSMELSNKASNIKRTYQTAVRNAFDGKCPHATHAKDVNNQNCVSKAESETTTLFIDAKKFKAYNDRVNYEFGDYVIDDLLSRLEEMVERKNIIRFSRYAGDESLYFACDRMYCGRKSDRSEWKNEFVKDDEKRNDAITYFTNAKSTVRNELDKIKNGCIEFNGRLIIHEKNGQFSFKKSNFEPSKKTVLDFTGSITGVDVNYYEVHEKPHGGNLGIRERLRGCFDDPVRFIFKLIGGKEKDKDNEIKPNEEVVYFVKFNDNENDTVVKWARKCLDDAYNRAVDIIKTIDRPKQMLGFYNPKNASTVVVSQTETGAILKVILKPCPRFVKRTKTKPQDTPKYAANYDDIMYAANCILGDTKSPKEKKDDNEIVIESRKKEYLKELPTELKEGLRLICINGTSLI